MSMRAAGLLGLCLCLAPASGLERLALVIGQNAGLAEEKPLSYATRDAQQVHAALAQLGGLEKGGGILLLDAGADQARQAMKELRERARALKARGIRSQVLIYYSGHGSGQALHLDGKTLPLSELRGYFAVLEADFKLLISDACFSGALIQAKGGSLADPLPIRYRDELNVNGSAILTSSSAGELAQESKELKGSLFTHYFVTALRGAADFDRDGRITLWEAYGFTQASMRRRLGGGNSPAQTPAFEVEANGSDQAVLTRLDQGQAFLNLRGLPPGEYRVLEAAGGSQIAELRLNDAEGARLALPRAAYLVYRGRGGASESGFADLVRDREAALEPGDFRPAGGTRLSAKGAYRGPPEPAPAAAPFRIALQTRWYPEFPGRTRPAAALEAGIAAASRHWGAAMAAMLLPEGPAGAGANDLNGHGGGVSGELRYHFGRDARRGFWLGPRGEYWLIRQTVNGRPLPMADMLGAFAGGGLEIAPARRLCMSFSGGAGWFYSRSPGDGLRRDPAFVLALALGYGP